MDLHCTLHYNKPVFWEMGVYCKIAYSEDPAVPLYQVPPLDLASSYII